MHRYDERFIIEGTYYRGMILLWHIAFNKYILNDQYTTYIANYVILNTIRI